MIPDRLIVSSKDAARNVVLMNPRLKPDTVLVSESLHLEPFSRPSRIMGRVELCEALGLNPARPYVCYTAASPAAVVKEDRIVSFLLAAVADGSIRGNPQIVLRLNPMEDGSRFDTLRSLYPSLVVQKPQWEWQRDIDWCCPLESDITTWVGTVAHAALNVSVPSTVSLEFAALGNRR